MRRGQAVLERFERNVFQNAGVLLSDLCISLLHIEKTSELPTSNWLSRILNCPISLSIPLPSTSSRVSKQTKGRNTVIEKYNGITYDGRYVRMGVQVDADWDTRMVGRFPTNSAMDENELRAVPTKFCPMVRMTKSTTVERVAEQFPRFISNAEWQMGPLSVISLSPNSLSNSFFIAEESVAR